MLVLTRNTHKNGVFLGSVEIIAQTKTTSDVITSAIERDAKKLGISVMFSIDLVLNSHFGAGCPPMVLAREINAKESGIRVEYIIRWNSSYVPF